MTETREFKRAQALRLPPGAFFPLMTLYISLVVLVTDEPASA